MNASPTPPLYASNANLRIFVHIPDGYLGPKTYVPLWAIMIPIWSLASRRLSQTLRTKQVPLLGMSAAFCFVLMLFNVPAPGGTTGHAVGATLVAIILGPWAAIIAVSLSLAVQAILFGDGGITALGANCFNMAAVMPLCGYGIYKLLMHRNKTSDKRQAFAAGTAAYVSLNVSALLTALELGLQPILSHAADGTPLYCPYSWRVTIPVLLGQHILFFGWIEAIITSLVVRFFVKADPTLMTPIP